MAEPVSMSSDESLPLLAVNQYDEVDWEFAGWGTVRMLLLPCARPRALLFSIHGHAAVLAVVNMKYEQPRVADALKVTRMQVSDAEVRATVRPKVRTCRYRNRRLALFESWPSSLFFACVKYDISCRLCISSDSCERRRSRATTSPRAASTLWASPCRPPESLLRSPLPWYALF